MKGIIKRQFEKEKIETCLRNDEEVVYIMIMTCEMEDKLKALPLNLLYNEKNEIISMANFSYIINRQDNSTEFRYSVATCTMAPVNECVKDGIMTQEEYDYLLSCFEKAIEDFKKENLL